MASVNEKNERTFPEMPRSDQFEWPYICRFVLEDDGNKSFPLKGFMNVKAFFFLSWAD